MDVIRGEHMLAMKDEAILCNIGHFDSEIQVAWLENNREIKEENIKPQVDQFILSIRRINAVWVPAGGA